MGYLEGLENERTDIHELKPQVSHIAPKSLSGSGMETTPGVVETIEMNGCVVITDIIGKIPLIHIKGEITSRQQLIDLYQALLQRNGILDDPQKFLIRNVRKSKTPDILSNGCERNNSSYRDSVLEDDFNLKASDYTYCHSFDGREQEYLTHAIYNPNGTDLVIYESDKMIPHHEEKYDKASSLGLGPTKVTFEFKDKIHKIEAVRLIVKSEFNDINNLDFQ